MVEKDKKVKLGEVLVEFCCKNKDDGKLPVYSVTNNEGFVLSTDYFSKEVFSKNLKTYKIVENGDFAYNPSRINVGSIDYYKGEGKALISPLYVTFKVKNDIIDRRYLKYFLKSSYGLSEIRRNTSGSVRDTLSFGQLTRISINLPSLAKQKLIVKELDKVSLLIEKRKESITLLDKYLESIFSDMFGDPIRNGRNWDLKKLDTVCKRITVGYVGTLAPIYRDKGIPILRSLNVKRGKISLLNVKYVERSFHEKNKKSSLRPLDVVSVRTGLAGVASVIPESIKEANCADLIVMSPGDKLNPYFLCEIFNKMFGDAKTINGLTGAIQKHFNIKVVKDKSIIVPPLELQNSYAKKVRSIDLMKGKMEYQLSKMINRKESLLSRL